MFTGIIQGIGSIRTVEVRAGDARLYVRTGALDLSDVALGDSIATNGVCLTVVELPGDGFKADVSRETLGLTTLGSLQSGNRVNLEKALSLCSRLGGHLVSGHVDGIGEVQERRDDARSIRFAVQAPADLRLVGCNRAADLRGRGQPDGQSGGGQPFRTQHRTPYPAGNHHAGIPARAAGQPGGRSDRTLSGKVDVP